MILHIEREWGKYPGWFADLSKDAQMRLIADHRMQYEDPKARAKKYRAAKRARFDKMRSRALQNGTEIKG